MAGTAEYKLDRGLIPSLRLNLQHFLFKASLGYDLHPCVPIRDEHLRVAEVGGGTSIWLNELSHRMPSTTEFVEFDVSSAQFPHPSLLPGNFTFHTADARLPPPPEHCGKFDIVHLRLFSAVVENEDPSRFIQHALALLKPGGYFQWTEFDNRAMEPRSGTGGTPDSSLQAVCGFFTTGGRAWVKELPEWFEKCGFDCLVAERRREAPWLRQMLLQNNCIVTQEGATGYAKAGRITAETAAEWVETAKRVKDAGDRGDYFKQIFQVVVGRKPLV